jgi:RNAse (barnase) inhibitor barstar
VCVQRGIDYEPLRAALKEQDFYKADDIHRKKLIEVAGDAAQERGWVYFSEVRPAMQCAHVAAVFVCCRRTAGTLRTTVSRLHRALDQAESLTNATGAANVPHVCALWDIAHRNAMQPIAILWQALQDTSARTCMQARDLSARMCMQARDIPVEDLQTIDKLWLAASGGKFGFSVQRSIWNSVGGKWSKFFQAINWLKYRAWPAEFIYDLNEATKGHLPLTNALRGTQLFEAILTHPAFEKKEKQAWLD